MDRPTALVPRHYIAIGGRGPADLRTSWLTPAAVS